MAGGATVAPRPVRPAAPGGGVVLGTRTGSGPLGRAANPGATACRRSAVREDRPVGGPAARPAPAGPGVASRPAQTNSGSGTSWRAVAPAPRHGPQRPAAAHHHAGATEARRPRMRRPFRPYRKQNIGRGRAGRRAAGGGRRAVEEGAPWVSPRHRPPPASVGQSVAWCGSAGGHGDQRVSGSGVATRTTRAARASSAAAIAADVASQSGARARSTALGRVASVNEPP